ncbi:MAG: Lrp/AsnC family transcriptional regulator [Candidatus Aenigmarchaeota archaeon]|nr:Lrp/AsnC family transcriptional regulator [Candidatus Aenigmarchaeota archaeon]
MKTSKKLDASSRVIISELGKNGRTKLTALAKKLSITPAAVKERVERLMEKNIVRVIGVLNVSELFPISSIIGIEADANTVNILIRKFRTCPLAFHLSKTTGVYNLVIGMVAEDMEHLENRINYHIRNEPGLKHVEVNIGHGAIVPEFRQLRLWQKEKTDTCICFGGRCDECPAYVDLGGSCRGCPDTLFYKDEE